jgi:hypothetical protein
VETVDTKLVARVVLVVASCTLVALVVSVVATDTGVYMAMLAADEVFAAVVATVVAVLPPLETTAPKASLIAGKYPVFSTIRTISQDIMPPKESKVFAYAIISAKRVESTNPDPAAVVEAGIPMKTFTSLFFETVEAQVSHAAKLKTPTSEEETKFSTPHSGLL